MRKNVLIKKSHFFWILTFLALFIFIFLILSALDYLPFTHKTDSPYPGLRLMLQNENQKAYISNQAEQCEKYSKSNNNRYKCLYILGRMLTEQMEFKEIVQSLRASNIECHDLMHNILNAQYKKGAEIEHVWAECSSTCDNACYHGGLEGLIIARGKGFENDKDIQSLVKELCKPIKDKHSEIYYQCFHGAGHAFMLLTNGNLPKSLILCDAIEEAGLRTNCYGGVFMENFPNSKSGQHVASYVKDDDPLYPCNAIDRKYQYSCYSFLPSYHLYLSGDDIEKFAEFCSIIPPEYQSGCYYKIGYMSIKQQSRKSDVLTACELVPEGEKRGKCIEGLTMGHIELFPRSFQIMKNEGAYDLCEKIDVSYKENCYNQIETVRKDIELDTFEKKKECGAIEDSKEREQCMSRN